MNDQLNKLPIKKIIRFSQMHIQQLTRHDRNIQLADRNEVFDTSTFYIVIQIIFDNNY